MILVRTELRITSILNHPNIVRMYDHFDQESITYIIMEEMAGGELYKYIKKTRFLKEFEVHHLIVAILRALDYLHGK